MNGLKLSLIGANHQPMTYHRSGDLVCQHVTISSIFSWHYDTMPSTIRYRPELIDELISQKRIQSYQKVFDIQSDTELVGVYVWNNHVASSILPLLSFAEITLRNAIDSALRQDLGSFWWKSATLKYTVTKNSKFYNKSTVPSTIESIRNNFESASKAHKKDSRKRYNINVKNPAHAEVIAKTDFSTWQFLFSDELMGQGLIWPKNLGKVLRGPWPSTSASTTLSSVHDLIANVREFRNRISHHEPLWKAYGVLNEQDAINYLRTKIHAIEKLIEIIHPESLLLLKKNGVLDAAYRACSYEEIQRFKYRSVTHTISSMGKLSKLADTVHHQSQVLQIKVYGQKARRLLIIPN